MNICLLQTAPLWAAPQENRQRVEQLLTQHAGADCYLLPEMWGTGYQTTPEEQTARDGADCLAWMNATARERRIFLAGSLPLSVADDERTPATLHNTFVLAGPEQTVFYHKRHLFTYGGEDRCYTPGHVRVVAQMGEWRVLPQVCYDLRFPVFSRCRGDYDMALYVANWPASRQAAWETLLRARAIENQCYVCGVNRVGSDPACRYGGGSMVISPKGEVLAALGAAEAVATVHLGDDALEKLQHFRQKFPALRDADDFRIDLHTSLTE